MDNLMEESYEVRDNNGVLTHSPDTTLSLNPFFRIHFGPPITCDLLLDGKTLEFPDMRYIALLAQLGETEPKSVILERVRDLFNLDDTGSQEILDDLVERRVLIADRAEYDLTGVRHWIRRGWLDALVLHLRTRDIECLDDNAVDSYAYNDMVVKGMLRNEPPPSIWKEYPQHERYPLGQTEELPPQTLDEVLLRRRSFEPWQQRSLRFTQLSTMLSYANKETVRLRREIENNIEKNPSVLFNSSFAALETYFFAFAIDGLPNGLYHYEPRTHAAVMLRPGTYKEEIARMCIGQRRPSTARCVFVISAVFERYMYRYRHARAYRNLLINVSEFAHKYILLATAFNLSTFLTPALQDEYADQVLGMNGYTEAPLYVVAIG